MNNSIEKYLNKVTCGDNLVLTRELPDSSIDAVLIDPPFGEHQNYHGDDTLRKAKLGLRSFLEVVNPKLRQNAHLAVFWTMKNVDVCIEEVKSLFTFRRIVPMYIPTGNARPYLGWLPKTQAIVVAQKHLPGHIDDFHDKLSAYLDEKLRESGLTRSALAKQLRCDPRLVSKWTKTGDPQRCIPTKLFYAKLKEILSLSNEYDLLLEREEAHKVTRNDFEYKHDCYVVKEKSPDMLHPAQKPLAVIEHVVSCICPEGGVVLDGFCGSGTTAIAARCTGRNFVCFDVSQEYCDIANRRLNDFMVHRTTG